MPLSTSSSEFARAIPNLPWRGITVIVVLLVFAAAAAWELYVRSIGYAPTLNDTEDLWAQTRRKVRPESLVIIGDSRGWFDLDLDELERGLGKRPVQLALPGSCAYPVLAELANDERFHGTVLCSFVPRMWFAPGGSLVENSEKAIHRYRNQTLSQRTGHHLGMFLEERVAFLKERDLTLEALLKQLPIANRPGALAPPRTPPYFATVDRERRARMIERCAQPGELQRSITRIWSRNFTPPPPPSYIPKEVFFANMKKAREARFVNTTNAVEKLRARGGKAVFLRLPVSGELKALEDPDTPRAQTWEPLLKMTGAAGISFEDFPELSTFTCPEWSHLSAGDSVEFSKRLVPHLRSALQL
jgi:transposase